MVAEEVRAARLLASARRSRTSGVAWLVAAILGVLGGSVVASPRAQSQPPTPQPFPRPADAQAQRPQQPPPQNPAPAQPATPPVSQPTAPAALPKMPPPEAPPTEASLGMPIYPGAQFIASYDAGRGQRYYLFGTVTPYEQTVLYYRNILKQRGEVIFEEPPTHIFEVGRYREETMAFPPSVVVKDYLWGGLGGYLNVARAEPARFPTIIQIVPPPAGTPRQDR